MRDIYDIQKLHGVKVLVSAPLNEPVENGVVSGDFRLRRTIPTIKFLTDAGAIVIVCGHIGREQTETLKPIYKELKKYFSSISFSSEAVGSVAQDNVNRLKSGDVLVLENLRKYNGEIENDKVFASELSKLADIFVQDAFDTSHRKHASIVGIPEILPAYAGILLVNEVRELSKALVPRHKAVAIIGGAKFATKEPVLEKLLSIYDSVVVGGALANDFLAVKGYSLGMSLMSGADLESVKTILNKENIVIPIDAVVAKPQDDISLAHNSSLDFISSTEAILDAGPETRLQTNTIIKNAETILWNGPLGHYENGFTEGTKSLAEAIASSTAYSIVGGGDTITAIEELGISEHFSFISTGGGAMLDFLTHGTLLGIDAIVKSEQKFPSVN